jgi:hypothetical protein
MKADISIGEALDKLSILSIKKDKIKEEKKLINIHKEFDQLTAITDSLMKNQEVKILYHKLLDINKKIWDTEDEIREKEQNKQFDQRFIDLARSVYINNDIRADIKKQINISMNSDLIEEKSYSNIL